MSTLSVPGIELLRLRIAFARVSEAKIESTDLATLWKYVKMLVISKQKNPKSSLVKTLLLSCNISSKSERFRG